MCDANPIANGVAKGLQKYHSDTDSAIPAKKECINVL